MIESIIYDNCSDIDKHMLDKAQLSSAKIIFGCLKLHSPNAILHLNLKALCYRREISMLVYFSKIIFHFVPCPYHMSLLDRSVNLFPTHCATIQTLRFHFLKISGITLFYP